MKIANRNLLLLALAAALAAAAPACGSDSSSDDGGGAGGTQLPDTGAEDCFNGIDDDGDGAVDCDDPDCAVLEACVATGCTTQVGAGNCEGDFDGAINRVCIEGACDPAGLIEDGTLVRGDVMVLNKLVRELESLAGRNRAYIVDFVHTARPDGSAANCDELFAAGLADDLSGFNVVDRSTAGISDSNTTVPALAQSVPLPPSSQGWLALTRFYGAMSPNGTPGGELMGLGCAEGITFPAGAFSEEEREERSITVTIEPVCDPRDQSTCTDGKTCVQSFVCRDRRCGDDCIGPSAACREVAGEPQCLKKCDPANPTCNAGERCDTTPGEPPACVPVE